MDQNRQQELIAVYRDGLLTDTLPFWIKFGIDREYGGFLTSVDQQGGLVDTDKGVWQQGRFSWLLGELYNHVEPRQEWLELLHHGIKFLDDYCFDSEDGRMWFQLTQDGRPIRKRRYSFSESFAAIAYGEFAKATQSDEYAEKAKRVFRQFVQNSRDVDSSPKYTNVRRLRGIGVPMITINTAQELRDSIELEEATEWIDQSIDEIQRFHLKADLQCVVENVGQDGEIVDCYEGRTLNPGHAIEGAWFIMEEGRIRGDKALIDVGLKMLDWMWHRGWDSTHGGLFYFIDIFDRPVQEYWHDMKFWWPHNEAIIATLLAWKLSGDEKYCSWHTQVHDWAYQNFADEQGSEWFGYLHRDGSISSTAKGNLWKGPFHLPRMQLKCWEILKS